MKLSLKQKSTYMLVPLMALGLLSTSANAQENANQAPTAALSATATVNLSQDTVHITLAAEEAAASQDAVAGALNKKLDSVMQEAKKDKNVSARSGTYRIWPTTDKDGKISQWRGHAEIILKSGDFAASSSLAAKLSDRMPINNLSFSVSDEKKAEQEEKLIQQAVQSLNTRAKILASALGYKDYQIIKIDLGGSGNYPISPVPRMMSAMATKDSVNVPIEAGEESLSVSIQAEISLQPSKK